VSVKDFVATVQLGDSDKLKQLPGIGKKTAERLIIEMRDRLGKSFGVMPETGAAPIAGGDAMSEAFSALLSLGYRDAEARQLLNRVKKPDATSEDLIRLALQSALK
jgi:Holliday junction DNA helicase RuvA